MLRLNGSYILILFSVLFFCSCQKELSLEGTSAGTAVFTFDGGTGACTNAVVNGTYQVDTALTASNTVTLAVDVTTIGTYTVTTATLNGISFTGTGVFTSTGPQTVTIMGTGIPTVAGAASFTPGPNGCSFIVNISSGGGGSGGTAVYTLSGAPGNCVNFTPGGTYTAGTPLGATNFATVSVNVTTAGTYTITTSIVNGISFSGSGTFAAAGVQTINLAGTGTPRAAGTFNYTPGTNGCTFPITVSAAGGAAVFTYAGAPNACTTATPAGTFDAGTTLTATNTVTIGVNVTSAGTYSISTPLVNGFSFTDTGSFATTGLQSVTLTGTGTPVAAGPSDFVLPNGCSFSITVNSAADFLKCTIDGVARTFNVGLIGINPDPVTFALAGDETSAPTTPTFQIELADATIIGPKVYNAYSLADTTTYCGILYYDDPSQNPWGVALAGQSGGFSVTVTSYTATKITGTFSGTLYINIGTGNSSKTVTAGSFSVSY